MRKLKNILVTGGAGFIGSNFIRTLLQKGEFHGRIINLDNLTYAGNRYSLADVERRFLGTRYFFEKGNITDKLKVQEVFERYEIDTVVHFAAESHVDRSILGPELFIQTNITGTFVLLENARNYWKKINYSPDETLFHHISTDEVYGSLNESGFFSETTPYAPRSPYSASKAASDHLVMSYYHTYGFPVTISNCSNNYGPYQFPEKFIPLSILNILENKPLPVYGEGKNVRDWIYVIDHVDAVWKIMNLGIGGEKYNIGGENEWENIKLLRAIIGITAQKTNRDGEEISKNIAFVRDRPGHDLRYAVDCSKIKNELDWKQTTSFYDGLSKTIDWYLENGEWVKNIRTGEYQNWIEQNYGSRPDNNKD
jgi:dTDP-glucose 4,6-dehydratase